MGKYGILLVLAFSLTVGYIGYILNNSKSGLVTNVSGFDRYANARNIAHTSLNMLLHRFDTDDPTLVDSVNAGKTVTMVVHAMSGLCSLQVKLTHPPPQLDTVDIYASAHFMDTTRTMNLRLQRHPVPFPQFNSAVNLHIPNVNFQMSGNPSIDGRDHDMNGNLLPSPPDSNYKPGVGVLTKADSITVAGYGSKIQGSQDVKVDPTITDPSSYVPEYINAASYTYGSGVYNSYTWGTPTDPTIVYCNGNVKFNGNAIGYGMLVVNGSLTLAGTFQWYGIVICYQSTTIDVQFASGTPNVYGAVLAAGASGSDFIMKGNSNVSYSAAAVNAAEYEINGLQVYHVVYWYE